MVALVVDDSEIVRKVVETILEHRGIRHIEACDGRDAISKFEEHSVEMIVTDLLMPNMNGLELIRWVRSNALYERLPVIVMSSEGEIASWMEYLTLFSCCWITKPFTVQMFMQAVDSCVPLSKDCKA